MNLNEYEIFNRYFNGGAFALPFLLKFTCAGCPTLYFVNNTESINFEGNLYHHASFEYSPPDSNGKGANLRISAADNELIEFVENADDGYRLDVVGLIAEVAKFNASNSTSIFTEAFLILKTWN
jgi:hypothetical protein